MTLPYQIFGVYNPEGKTALKIPTAAFDDKVCW